MYFLQLIYPGLGWTVGLMLFILGLTQVDLYVRNKLKRSKHLAIFCFCSSLFAINVGIVYSQAFSVEFTRHFVVDLQFVLYLGLYHYLKAMNYFVAIPRFVKKIYLWGMIIIGCLVLIPAFSLIFFGKDIYFDSENLVITGNFFVDSYTARFGAPRLFSSLCLGILGALNIFATTVMLYRLRKSSGDVFLMTGLALTLMASFFDIFLLPITLKFYIPLLFLSNVFEALRMCFLASVEALQRHQVRQGKEVGREALEVSSLDEETLSRLTKRLENLLKDKKIFRDPLLNLDSAAHAMRIPSYQLSQVIRFGLKTNFSDLINKLRVEEVQAQLAKPENSSQNLLEVAFSCGFNSKSTFNNSFKKISGVTPSEFRKKIKN